jgi:hypothetical protein
MLDSPVDAWYVWIGLSLVGMALMGIAAQLPDAPPPDASGPAGTVDAVAGGPHAESGSHSLVAEAVLIEPHRIGVRSDGETAYETFAYGPVTPVREGTLLWELLQGARPDHVFESPEQFAAAAERARDADATWRTSTDRLTVRNVSWEGEDVTLVGA